MKSNERRYNMKKILSFLTISFLMLSVVGFASANFYDANNDGKVNVLDLIKIRNEMCVEDECASGNPFDINGDGTITLNDLLLTKNNLNANEKNWGLIVNPMNNQNVRSEIAIRWIGEFEVGYLKYNKGVCTDGAGEFINNHVGSPGEENWDTTSLEDGLYCLKVIPIYPVNKKDQIQVTIDNTKPEVDLNVLQIGNEKNKPVKIEVNVEEENPNICEINWGDDTKTDCSVTEHQYKDNGNYKVTATATDKAGNSGTNSVFASVENVAPENPAIAISGELVINNKITFIGSAEDVLADIPLDYYWDFGDNSNAEGKESMHTYTKAGTYEITLIVSDKDNGKVELKQTIIIEPVINAGETKGVVDDSEPIIFEFETELDNPVCAIQNKPDKLVVLTDGNKCKIVWAPVSGQEGTYTFIVKATNGEAKYYLVKIIVYSWKINLNEGWNLFSIPLRTESSNINDVLGGIIENVNYDPSEYSVYQYNAVNDKWYKARPYADKKAFTGPSNYKLTDIVPGYAYWINMNNPDTIYGMKKQPSQMELPTPEIELASSAWNLIGKYNLGSVGIIKALQSLEGYYFENSVLALNNNAWTPTDTMSAGNGYWVRTTGITGQETIDYLPLGSLI